VHRGEGRFVNGRVGARGFSATGIGKGKRKEGEGVPRPRGRRRRVRRAAKGSGKKQHWRIKLLLEHGRGARRVWSSEGP
jgi:hypothetical protein